MVTLLLAALPCLAPAKAQPLDWLAGRWVQHGNVTETEEIWTTPAFGHLLGVNRSLVYGKQMHWEFLRIEKRADRVVYLAQPDGRHPPTPFCLAKSGPKTATFVNPSHDFPTQISYARVGDRLTVEISGGEKRLTLVLVRAPLK